MKDPKKKVVDLLSSNKELSTNAQHKKLQNETRQDSTTWEALELGKKFSTRH